MSLDRIVTNPEWAVKTNCNWTVCRRDTLESAVEALKEERMPVAICERHLPRGTWIDFLEKTGALLHPPLLIVSSRVADERLWAEALNLGAYDVLEKPFRAEEVTRIVNMAWLHWRERHEGSACTALRAGSAGVG